MQALRIRPIAGLLLTGGAARRLGRDKAGISLDGRSLAQRGAEVLGAVCDPCLEVGPGRSGLRAVREARPGTGPFAAMVAGVATLRAAGWAGPAILLAVDMPAVDAALLRRLVDAPPCDVLLPVVDGHRQPLCARYSAQALDMAADALAGGTRSMHRFVDELPPRFTVVLSDVATWAPGDVAKFADIDTAEDLKRLVTAGPRQPTPPT